MVNAVLMAGYSHDKGNYEDRADPFIEIAGKANVKWVYEALRATSAVDKIVVVGHKKGLEKILGKNVDILDSDGTIVENGLRGYEHLSKGPTLFVAKDVPLLMPDHVQRFILNCDMNKGDVYVPFVSCRHIKKIVPDDYHRKLRYLNVFRNHEGERDEIRLGNMLMVNPDNVERLRIINTLYAKSTLRRIDNKIMAGLYGVYYGVRYQPRVFGVVLDAFTRRLSYEKAERAASGLLGTRLKIVESEDAETALDVDWEIEDLPVIEKLLEERLN